MCGQVGLLIGRRRRDAGEVAILKQIFVDLLKCSEARGRHASGVAVIDRDGRYRLFKRPIPATKLVEQPEFACVMNGVEGHFGRAAGRTTLVMGHTRYRTRGCESNNANNHPLRVSRWAGTANGTILNANALFRRYRLRRHAEVDSELILRLADKFSRNGDSDAYPGVLDVPRFLDALRPVRGQLSAVFSSLDAPDTTYLIHGNRPLVLRAHRKYRVIAYASECRFLDAALANLPGWRRFYLPPMTLAQFSHEDLLHPEFHELEFIAQERPTLRDLPAEVAIG